MFEFYNIFLPVYFFNNIDIKNKSDLCGRQTYIFQKFDVNEYRKCKSMEKSTIGKKFSNGACCIRDRCGRCIEARIQKFGIPNIENEYENSYYVKRVSKYQTLAEALERLKTHPVVASLATFSGWEDREVYRGPLKEGYEFDGSHEVLMLEC